MGLVSSENRNKSLIYISRSRLHRNRANLIQTLHTVEALVEAGIEVKLYVPPWKRGCSKADRLQELGIYPWLPLVPTKLLKSSFGLWPFAILKRRELINGGVVYTRSPEISLMLIKSNIPHCLEIHGVKDLERRGAFDTIIRAHRENKIFYLFPISRGAAKDLIGLGASKERIRICPSGVSLERFEEIPSFDPKRLDRPTFVHVGRIGINRGLRVFEAIREEGLGEVILVGEPDKDFPDSCQLGLRPPVPHSQVQEWYGKSDIILLPYQPTLLTADSMSPMKLFESLAAGRPIIASNLPPIGEIIEHGVSGLLVDPSAKDGWLRAVKQLQEDRQLALKLATNAKKMASKFTWKKRAAKIIDALGWQ